MNRREAVITGVVLCAFCMVVAGLFFVARSDTGELSLDTALADADPAPADPDDELAAFVEEAIDFVETTRSGSFLTDPVVVTLDDDEFVAQLQDDMAADFAADPEAVEMFDATYRATGLIEPDESIEEVYSRFGAAGVLGFYDPVTDELVVRRRDELSLLTKSTIVHELTHAYDDQHFDLDRPEYDERTDEIGWTFRAVAEGSASWVEAEWEATLGPDEQADLLQEEFEFADPGVFQEFEFSFLLLELSPYEYGEVFVEYLVLHGGTAALDEAITSPPVTSEQVMIPDSYVLEEGPIGLPAPPADGEVQFSGLGGLVLIDSLFTGESVIRTFAWGGDQLVVWTESDMSCMRWDLQADDGSTAAIVADFEAWGAQVGGADVDVLDAQTVRVERCV